jgi:AcrR family transcriptional regulator
MAYRRTDNVMRRLHARREAIVAAAREVAAEGGMAAVQMASVANRAGIAAGTIYRYFPGKMELVGALIASMSEQDVAATERAAGAAPGPLSALAAAVATFAARALRNRKLAWAVIAYRKAFAAQLEGLIASAVAGGHLPEQDAALAAPVLVGALLEGLIGPLAPEASEDFAKARAAVQALTLFALRGLGVLDARARGLVVQTALPDDA